jgi:hypothetical protein
MDFDSGQLVEVIHWDGGWGCLKSNFLQRMMRTYSLPYPGARPIIPSCGALGCEWCMPGAWILRKSLSNFTQCIACFHDLLNDNLLQRLYPLYRAFRSVRFNCTGYLRLHLNLPLYGLEQG